jgi:hypothetical protein
VRQVTLQRSAPTPLTVNGVLLDEDSKQIACTAEHPTLLILAGTYICFLQIHYNKDGTSYPAYEVRDVPGKTDIELHIGNDTIKDSLGCILVGMETDAHGITPGTSTAGFHKFMNEMNGDREFLITIIDHKTKEETMSLDVEPGTPTTSVAGTVSPSQKENVIAVIWRLFRGAVAVAIPMLIDYLTKSSNPKLFVITPLLLALGKALRTWFPNLTWLPF